MAEDSKLHDIHAILQRPVLVSDGEFNSSFTDLSLKFPDVILQKSANVVSKLDYFTFFRANVKVKLIFNATPFMSGKYWMFFSPFDAISNRGSRLADLPNTTGYPGIEIDIASNAPVEIKIPYCSPLSHYNLLDTHSNMGELSLVPINDIRSGVSPVSMGAPFSIFAWFEDIELAMPTSAPVTVPLLLDAQMAKSEEQAVTSGPPISGVAKSVASASAMLGNTIPLLGKWLRPVEWVSRAIGGAAEAVGWNKPTNLDKNCPFINVPAKGYTNADGIDLSSKLCAMPDNGLTWDGGIFSTDVDEMDIKYVAKKSCIFRSNILWETSDSQGTILHKNNVAPGFATNTGSLNPTTLAFLSSMFRYWRGGLKFRLSVAKTAFHTGRLRITYSPGVYTTASDLVYENAYNWILDLSISSELEFEIPYISNVPWKETLITDTTPAIWSNEKYSTGIITVEVLTPLRASSDSVSSTCPFNMWICGGDDIAFAIPDFGSYSIASPNTFISEELDAQIFNQTAAGIQHNEQVSNTASQMFPKSPMDGTKAEELTMGEKITSLRQLIKRFGITSRGESYPYQSVSGAVWALPGPIPLNNDNFLFNQVTLDPAYFGEANGGEVTRPQNVTLPTSTNGDGDLNTEDCVAANHYPTRSPLYYISYLYRFYRGGRRYKVANPSTNGLRSTNSGLRPAVNSVASRTAYTTALDGVTMQEMRPTDPLIVVRNTLIEENGNLTGPQVTTFLGTDTAPLFEHYVYPDLNGTLEFEVPYYAQTPISLVGEGRIVDNEGPVIRRSKVQLRRSENPRGMDRPVYDYTSNTFTPFGGLAPFAGGIRNCFGAYTLYEAAADDFSFGYLIGAPRLDPLLAP